MLLKLLNPWDGAADAGQRPGQLPGQHGAGVPHQHGHGKQLLVRACMPGGACILGSWLTCVLRPLVQHGDYMHAGELAQLLTCSGL